MEDFVLEEEAAGGSIIVVRKFGVVPLCPIEERVSSSHYCDYRPSNTCRHCFLRPKREFLACSHQKLLC